MTTAGGLYPEPVEGHALHQPSSTWYWRDLNQGNWYATQGQDGAWCSHGTCELNLPSIY